MSLRSRAALTITLVLALMLSLVSPALAAPTARLDGTLRTTTGDPLASGRVWIYHVEPGGSYNGVMLYTDALGRWSEMKEPGDYKLLFGGPDSSFLLGCWTSTGYVPLLSMAETITVSAGETRTIDGTVGPGADIKGRVTSTVTGLPIPSPSIILSALTPAGDWLWTFPSFLLSGMPDGTFDLPGLVPGRYRFSVHASGYKSRDIPTSEETTEGVDVTTIGQQITGLDVELEPNIRPERVEGPDRVQTSIVASKKTYPGGGAGDCDAVVIATGYNWPDALGGAALAYAVDGPLLLTAHAPASMPATLLAEVQRLKGEGASQAYVLGSERGAVGKAVTDALVTEFGEGNVHRLGGADRYATSAIVATTTIEKRGPGNFDGTVMIATGGNFADAMAAAPVSAKMGWPILLAQPDGHGGLSDSMTAFVAEKATKAIILGSDRAVPSGVAADLANALGGWDKVERWEGSDRIGTSISIAEHAVALPGSPMTWDGLAFSYGWNYPDSLSCGPLVASVKPSVILLTPNDPNLTPSLKAKLADLTLLVQDVRFLGGSPNPLSEPTRGALIDALD